MMIHEIGPKRLRNEYQNRTAEAEDLFLTYGRGTVLAKGGLSGLAFPTVSDMEAAYPETFHREQLTYLFRVDDTVFYTDREQNYEAFAEYEYTDLQYLRQSSVRDMIYAAVTGNHLFTWYRKSQYCGRCGAKNEHDSVERGMRCPVCGNIQYPAISPSVIVGITDGDRLLVTKYTQKHLPYAHYALVAGYIEIGESPEEAVRREVAEEVGVEVTNIRYYGSQPWGFSGSLLLGYLCDLKGSPEITLQEDELSEAVWMNRADLPDRKDQVSLTSEMIERFRLGEI